MKAPTDVLLQLLELSRMFMSNDVREFAIKEIHNRRLSIPPCSLISISVEHNIEKLFKYGFQCLVKARLDDLTDKDYSTMDPRIWAAVLKSQSTIQLHCWIVACEPPPTIHAAECPDTESCDFDWVQLWWNTMGRMLLDGRNPKSYKDALRLFEELTEIGNVSLGCWHLMITKLRGGLAFIREDEFIEHAAKKWAEQCLPK